MKKSKKDLVTLTTSASFDSAHYLTDYDGKCSNIHGHRWTIEAQFKGEVGDNGMLVDFGDIKKILNKLADFYDHSLILQQPRTDVELELIEFVRNKMKMKVIVTPFRTTAENFAKSIFEDLTIDLAIINGKPQDTVKVVSVTVYETPTNSATYKGGK